ncbi:MULTISPECIES: helix-turn-helix domain-containing protein [Haloarcula]|uniref:helix-turn-helix domain-containing protein n=1 Tax=Haloarcula TaxID=2237 RepID=UPI0023E82F96|nr:helix-turn-helix domain-containing protein [Halomicroarcula sp. SHR3]
MSEDEVDDQAVFEVLADPDCREILAAVEEPLPAKDIAAICDLPQTSTYRKLQQLSGAGLVAEETEVRTDGHHATMYVRNTTGIFVPLQGESAFDVERLHPRKSADERLALLWSRIREEL